MSRVLLQLNVPSYLKKILVSKLGENYRPKEDNLYGLAIINTLKRKSEHNYEYRREHYSGGDYRFKNSTEQFFIYISVDRASRRGFSFDPRRSFQIVKAFDKQIREELYTKAIFNKENYGIDYQTTINDWLNMYDISEEELSYDSIRKDFNRNRIKLMKKLKIIA